MNYYYVKDCVYFVMVGWKKKLCGIVSIYDNLICCISYDIIMFFYFWINYVNNFVYCG